MGLIYQVLPHAEYMCGLSCANGDGEKGQCFQNDTGGTLRLCTEDVAMDFLHLKK